MFWGFCLCFSKRGAKMLPWACKVPLSLKGKLFALISSPSSSHRSPSRHKPCEDKGAGEKATCPNVPKNERFGAHKISQVTSTLPRTRGHMHVPRHMSLSLSFRPEQPNQSHAVTSPGAQTFSAAHGPLLDTFYLCRALSALLSSVSSEKRCRSCMSIFVFGNTV